MAQRLSRRSVANYIADEWIKGTDRSRLVSQLAAYLVESRRISEAALFIRDIEEALAERGQVVARIASAKPLGDQLETTLTRQIKSDLKADTVEIDASVDPSLLGGVRVELPGFEYDNTLRRRLQALRSQALEKQV